MQEHVLTASTSAPAFAEKLNLDDLETPQSDIEVLCTSTLVDLVHDAMVPITKINVELGYCAFSGRCDKQQSKKVRRLADKTAKLVGQVRDHLPNAP